MVSLCSHAEESQCYRAQHWNKAGWWNQMILGSNICPFSYLSGVELGVKKLSCLLWLHFFHFQLGKTVIIILVEQIISSSGGFTVKIQYFQHISWNVCKYLIDISLKDIISSCLKRGHLGFNNPTIYGRWMTNMLLFLYCTTSVSQVLGHSCSHSFRAYFKSLRILHIAIIKISQIRCCWL
jgi:hypothetical protein